MRVFIEAEAAPVGPPAGPPPPTPSTLPHPPAGALEAGGVVRADGRSV